MNNMKIGVVFVLHNNLQELLLNFSNLSKTENKLFLLIIDNGSSDNTKEELHSSGISFLDLEQNIGFTKSVNIGVNLLLEKYDIDWVFIITPDIEIKPYWDRLLFDTIINDSNINLDEVGTISPSIVDFGGLPVHCGIEFSEPCLDTTEIFVLVKDFVVRKTESLGLTNVRKVKKISKKAEFRPAVQFYFVGFRPNIWEEFGKLDEKYEFYGSDIIFSLNVGTKYKNIVSPLVLRHIGMKSFIMNLCLSDGQAIQQYKNDRLLFNKELMEYGSYYWKMDSP